MTFRSIAAAATLAVLVSCDSATVNESVSTDKAALERLVVLPYPIGTVRWELVSTPEPGGVPGPTDYRTIVAVLRPKWPETGPKADRIAFVPNAARRWLPDMARTLVAKSIHDSKPPADCRTLTAMLQSNSNVVSGMNCEVSDYTLLYLTVQNP